MIVNLAAITSASSPFTSIDHHAISKFHNNLEIIDFSVAHGSGCVNGPNNVYLWSSATEHMRLTIFSEENCVPIDRNEQISATSFTVISHVVTYRQPVNLHLKSKFSILGQNQVDHYTSLLCSAHVPGLTAGQFCDMTCPKKRRMSLLLEKTDWNCSHLPHNSLSDEQIPHLSHRKVLEVVSARKGIFIGTSSWIYTIR